MEADINEMFRPNTLDEMILAPHLRSLADKGLRKNYLFHSDPGSGKTTLVRILIKKHPHLILDKKIDVETLRTTVEKFCTQSMAFDNYEDESIRVVYFEEIDTATYTVQEELKTFMEKKRKYPIRFIATCNNLTKLHDPILSRFTSVEFVPYPKERDDVKAQMVDRLMYIAGKIGVKGNQDDIKGNINKIVNRRFPEMRSMVDDVDMLEICGLDTENTTINSDEVIFKYVLSPKVNEMKLWEYLYREWKDRYHSAFMMLGRPFFKFVQEKYPNKINGLPNAMIKLSEYSDTRLSKATDPFVTLYALVLEMRKCFNA